MNIYILDCYNKSIGRMASIISIILKRIDNHSLYCTSKLALVNVCFIKIGVKLLNKKYWRHTGYPGGIKYKFGYNFGNSILIKTILSKMLNNRTSNKNILKRLLIIEDLKDINKDSQYINV
ncbi:50S ribosomal protein L13 [Candidatus Hodgkinia cicadicola]|uniref:50S ribosomal protein L13 n=1 Tax=Candidatus Hodgkinia cicadicola TaxID=573658 RepID=A0ABX4MGV6_9HYPH|nr:50S ribosomal protein L13 [Candidatus Hodgkinia cicadicola]PIM95987.1 50S ribosomal protein L13 [Candidatus Hodgkinia cicadicola]